MNIKDREHARHMDEEIEAAARFGVASVGHNKALDAALRMQTNCCLELFQLMTGVHRAAEGRGEVGMLPLTPEVIEYHQKAVWGTALVAAIMAIHEEEGGSEEKAPTHTPHSGLN